MQATLGARVTGKHRDLLAAIEGIETEEVKRLLVANPSLLNAKIFNGYTPLGHAIRGNYKNIVETLLSFNSTISLDTGDSLNPDAEDLAKFWGKGEIVQLIKNFKMQKKDKNLGLDLNNQRIISSPHQAVELNEEPNLQYAYDDEDINNRVNAEIFQRESELGYYSYDTKLKTFSANITESNQQKTNFLIGLKKQWQIIIVPAVSNALSDIEAVFGPIIKQIGAYIEWVKLQPHANNLIGIRLLFPYKLDVWHWNLGEISMALDGNKAITSCVGISHDPFGNGNIEPTLKEHLKRLLQSITHESNIDLNKANQFQLARQKNGVYCGIVAARDLLRRIDDLQLDDAKYCAIYNDEMDVRRADFELFRGYLNEEKFKLFFLKQKANNFDHYISVSQLQAQQDQISTEDQIAANELISEVGKLNLSVNLLQLFVSFFQNARELEFSNYFMELKNNLISFKEKLQDKQLEYYQSFLQNLFGVGLENRNQKLIKPEVVNAFYNCIIHQINSMRAKSPVTSIKSGGNEMFNLPSSNEEEQPTDRPAALVQPKVYAASKSELDLSKDKRLPQLQPVALTESEFDATGGDSIEANTKRDRIDNQEQLIKILIPANGDCLYTAVFLGYILPGINNLKKFKHRVRELIGAACCEELLDGLFKQGVNIEFLRSQAFSEWVNKFKKSIGIDNSGWDDSNGIKTLAEKLNIDIHVLESHPMSCTASSENLETVSILRVKLDENESVLTDNFYYKFLIKKQDYDNFLVFKESVQVAWLDDIKSAILKKNSKLQVCLDAELLGYFFENIDKKLLTHLAITMDASTLLQYKNTLIGIVKDKSLEYLNIGLEDASFNEARSLIESLKFPSSLKTLIVTSESASQADLNKYGQEIIELNNELNKFLDHELPTLAQQLTELNIIGNIEANNLNDEQIKWVLNIEKQSQRFDKLSKYSSDLTKAVYSYDVDRRFCSNWIKIQNPEALSAY